MAGGGGGGGGGQQQSTEYAPIWITVSCCIVLMVVWYFGHAYISAFIYKIRLAEIYILSFFTKSCLYFTRQIARYALKLGKFCFS